ncbi:hypothetical protein ACL1FJ_00545 [Corynebacterium striatum]
MGKVNLENYEPVEQRILRFKKDYPNFQIETELLDFSGDIGKSRWVMLVRLWKEPGYERPDATGHAFEVDGSGMANNTSALENCETSAIGRALANLGYGGNRRVTREEMAKVKGAEIREAIAAAGSRAELAQVRNGLIEDGLLESFESVLNARLSELSLDEAVVSRIKAAESEDGLTEIYQELKAAGDERLYLPLLSERKAELKKEEK